MAIDTERDQYYYWDLSFGEAYTLAPGTLEQTAGHGQLSALWQDAATWRVPNVLLGWNPDGTVPKGKGKGAWKKANAS